MLIVFELKYTVFLWNLLNSLIGAIRKLHIDGFGLFLLDIVVGNSYHGGIVSDCCTWWLWMTHFFGGYLHGTGIFVIMEDFSKFSFGSTDKN